MLRRLIFGEDARQATNIKRLLMAFASYIVCYAFVIVCYKLGMTRFTPLRLAALLALLIVSNGGFYLLIRTGINRRFHDPSLTLPQLYSSLVIITVGLYFSPEARGAMMFFFFFSYMFGLFQLVTREFLKVGAFALLAYGAILLSAYLSNEPGLNLRNELVQALALAIVTPWFALMGGLITQLRVRLRNRNEELTKALHKIQMLATHDELTGAYNRRYIMDALDREVAEVLRGSTPFSVCLIDIDFFKRVNDTYGHAAGDHVLSRFAELAQREMRSCDYFARYGGEEFLIVLVNTTANAALTCAERIRNDIGSTCIDFNGQALSVTFSAGIAEYIVGENVRYTIERADKALYNAKNSGRNRTVMASTKTAEPTATVRQSS